jgi:hypothetical protein
MAADDVALALIAIDEPGIRQQVQTGDLTALGTLDLSEDEKGLVREAAGDEPDVSGFDWTASSYLNAFSYLASNRSAISDRVRSQFSSFFEQRYGSSWRIALMG